MAACISTRVVLRNLKKISYSTLQRHLICASSAPNTGLCQINRQLNTSKHVGVGQQYRTENYSDEAFSESEDEHSRELLSNLRQKHRQTASQQHSAADGVQFRDFAINEGLVDKLEMLGYDEPFEIQAKTLPHTLEGRDVIGRALTGSGKTLAFSIPIIQKISQSERRRNTRSPKAIVISPTRELCQQIYRSIQELDPRVRCVALYGGDSYIRQESAMRRGIDVVCATPGRLNDHLQRGNLDLDELSFLCLDEADELLTPNFKVQIQDVLNSSPEGRQVMLFSATMPEDIVYLTKRYMSNPVFVDIAKNQKHAAPESVKHVAIKCNPATYMPVVKALIDEHQPERCIVFMETKVKTTHTAMVLRRLGLKADALNSDLTQRKREQILGAFRLGKLNVLVATDVAARGLDIPEVDLVIQADPPRNGVDFYIHRSGRTGRAGREGLAITLHSGKYEDWAMLKQVQRLVQLDHKAPPNQEQLESYMLNNVLKSIQTVNENDVNKYMPTLEKLDFSDEKGQQLLASAIAVIMKIKMGDTDSQMGRTRRDGEGMGHRSYDHTHGGYNKHHSSYRPNSYRHSREGGFKSSYRRNDSGYSGQRESGYGRSSYRGLHDEE